MSILQCVPLSFRLEALQGIHDLLSDTLKMALYASTASLGMNTTAYTSSGEITGTGYSAGGVVLSGVSLTAVGDYIYFACSDPTWSSSTLAASAALVYNHSKSDRSVAVIDLGGLYTSTANTFRVAVPAALIRF